MKSIRDAAINVLVGILKQDEEHEKSDMDTEGLVQGDLDIIESALTAARREGAVEALEKAINETCCFCEHGDELNQGCHESFGGVHECQANPIRRVLAALCAEEGKAT